MIENRMLIDSEYPEIEPYCQCDMCGEPIYDGEDYWDINGDIVCEDCLLEYMQCFKRTAGEL